MTAPVDLAAFDGPLIFPGLRRLLGVDTDTPPDLDIDALAATARADQQYIDRTGLEA
jgi:hypothetical protein